MGRMLGCLLWIGIALGLGAEGPWDERVRHAEGPSRLQLLLEAAQDRNKQNPKQALTYATQAAALAKELGDRARWIEARSRQGLLLMDLGRIPEAAKAMEEARQEAVQVGDPVAKGWAWRSMGLLQEKLANYDQALQWLYPALTWFEEARRESLVAETLKGIGLVHYRLKREEDAQRAWDRALALYEAQGDDLGVAGMLNNLGVLAKNRKLYPAARDYYQRALAIQERLQDRRGIANILNNLGILAFEMKDYTACERYHQQALEVRESIGDLSTVAASCFNLADLYRDRQRWELGRPYLKRARQLAEEAKAQGILADCWRLESDYAAGEGDHRKALELYKAYHNARAKIVSEESATRAAELQARYDVDRQAKEIQLLRQEQAVRQARVRMGLLASAALVLVLVLLAARYRLKVRTARRMEAKNRELDEANRRLERANAFKSLFLASTSHELRTPVNAILGLSRLLKDPDAPHEERRRLVDAVLGSAEGLLHLLNDLLDAGKIEAGKLDVERIPMSIAAGLEDLRVLMEPRAREKHLSLVFRVDPELGDPVLGDPNRLRQVLLNLLSNAIKFTSHGEVSLEARRVAQEGDLQRVWFQVRDTGPGIPEDVQTRLFQAYVQADASTARYFGGTGLGLFISRQLVELMGGHLTLDSQPGAGAVFGFELSLERALESLPQEVPVVSRDAVRFHGRVLVADDNPANRLVSESVLRRMGLRVQCADHGQQALDLLEREPFEVVILDGQMPVLDGPSTAREVRQREAPGGSWAGRRHFLIALTGQAQPGDAERLLREGFDAYLSKPLDVDALHRTLQACLPSRKVLPEVELPPMAETAEPETWSVLRQALGGESAFQEFLRSFFVDGRQRVERLRSALGEGHRARLEREAHDLKSNAATLGFRDLSRAAWTLEAHATEGSEAELQASVTDVEARFRRIQARWEGSA